MDFVCVYVCVFVLLICFFETEFLCIALRCPTTSYVDKASPELTDICLPLSPKCIFIIESIFFNFTYKVWYIIGM